MTGNANNPSARCRSRRRALLFWALVCLTAASHGTGQTIPTKPNWRREGGVVALQQAVRDAQTDVQVMLVASHPDDRYVMPAAYLRFRLGFRVAVVLFTRGSGGQNIQGGETGEELARLRTMEAEACAAHLGIQVYYLNRPDGGFCRTAQEALDQWGRQSTTTDLARLVRVIRPDIVMTTHYPKENHGHDKALLEILPEAVTLAGNPRFTTRQTKAHQVSRLFRGTNEGEEPDLRLPATEFDHARGMSIRELAYEALLEHVSQQPQLPMEALLKPRLELTSIKLRDRPLRKSLVGDLSSTFELVRARHGGDALGQLEEKLGKLSSKLNSRDELLLLAAESLSRIRALEKSTTDELAVRLRRRVAALEEIMLLAGGVHIVIKADPKCHAVVGDEVPLAVELRNHGPRPVVLTSVRAVGGGAIRLSKGLRLPSKVERSQTLSCEGSYTCPALSSEALRRLFEADTFKPPLRLRFQVRICGQPISFERHIPKEVRQPLDIEVTPKTLLFSKDATEVRFVVSVTRNSNAPLNQRLRIKTSAGITVLGDQEGFGVVQVEMTDERSIQLQFRLKASRKLRPNVYPMFVHVGDKRLRVRVHKVDVRVPPSLRVGLVHLADNTARDVLQSLIGVSRVEVFDAKKPLPLLRRESFDTIVVDIRALRSGAARTAFTRLLDFARDGGRLVVLYHKDEEFNLETARFRGAPFPLRIGKGRVTREDAPVRVLLPDHLILNYPNKVRSSDWDGWIQERGLYFPQKYSSTYQELLELSDPDQQKEKGALLYARYGKGEYVYCALSLWRQLKDLHPGACRLFANLISRRESKD